MSIFRSVLLVCGLMIKLDDVKIVPCKECGVDVTVNAAYPITEVECRPHYCPKIKPDKK